MQYTPILQTKKGEMEAVNELLPDVKENIFPLFEVHCLEYSFADDEYTNDVEDRVVKIIASIKKNWGKGKPCYIDIWWLPENEGMRNGAHAYDAIEGMAANEGIEYIPVIYPDSNRATIAAVKRIAALGKSVCLRLPNLPYSKPITELIADCLSAISINANKLHAIIDCTEITPENGQFFNYYLAKEVVDSPILQTLERVVLAGTSFPPNLTSIDGDSIDTIPRNEWLMWNRLHQGRGFLEYSDYTISNPEPQEVDPRFMQQSASIRYTSHDVFVIVKGRSVKKHPDGWGQTQHLSQLLIQSGHYAGENFSWGDHYISERAQGNVTSGNATTWRKVGVNHHISLVVYQITSLSSA